MSSYAYRGEPFTPGTFGIEFAKPLPVHTMTPGALAAVEAVRAAGRAKRASGELVASHGRPPYVPYDRDPVPKAARDLLELAESLGFETNLIALNDRCTVEGIDRRAGVAFRAFWVRGRTNGGTWHERRERYAIIRDDRPVGVAALTRTGLKGKRPAGVGTTRLSLVASRLGMPYTITDLQRKVEAHGQVESGP